MPIDPESLANLWRDHSAGLVLFARARSDWAEDCVQEAFLQLAVLSAIPEDPVAWLATVVRNLAISKFRQESRRRQRESRYANDRTLWFQSDRPFGTGMTANEIQTAMMQLEPTERELIVAHVWNGLTFRQIAAVFEISSSTAHRNFLAAIESFRSILEASENRKKD